MEEGTLIKHGNENTNNKMVFGDSFDSGYKSDALEEKQEDKIELPGGVDINSQNDPVKMCSKCIRNKVNYIYIYIYIATKNTSLQSMWQMCSPNGPSLPLDNKLCRFQEL